ncbi:MAG TPA: DUF3471 domain-containing protein [Gemmatirosa sp.]
MTPGRRVRRRVLLGTALLLPAALAAQAPATGAATGSAATHTPATRESPDGVMLAFARFADLFGSRLVAAFDSIPEARYGYRPTPAQQTVGTIAEHLEDANYELCERLGDLKHPRTAKDSLADTVKARWPKDTLVTRLRASLRFCDTALDQVTHVQSAALANTLLAFETDLAEHYSQLSTYMRLLGLVPPSALPPRARPVVALPASELARYVGAYQLAPGIALELAMRDTALFVRSTTGGAAVRLWPESSTEFFVKEADAQVTFARDAGGTVTGLVLHQYGRDRPAIKIR